MQRNSPLRYEKKGLFDILGPMPEHPTHRLLILTGASGSGKTTLVQRLRSLSDACFLHFDSIGVPSEAEMIREHGSAQGWQKAMTREWLLRIQRDHLPYTPVVFEGQVRIRYLQECLAELGIPGARIILVDCDDSTRKTRLIEDRNQPDLADQKMMDWAQFLRREAIAWNCTILDTTALTVTESVEVLMGTTLTRERKGELSR
jgi:dephospho-CoA kinase